MSRSGGNLSLAGSRQVAEERSHELPTNGRKSVAVEEEERSPPMKGFQEIEDFSEGEDGVVLLFPLAFARIRSF